MARSCWLWRLELSFVTSHTLHLHGKGGFGWGTPQHHLLPTSGFSRGSSSTCMSVHVQDHMRVGCGSTMCCLSRCSLFSSVLPALCGQSAIRDLNPVELYLSCLSTRGWTERSPEVQNRKPMLPEVVSQRWYLTPWIWFHKGWIHPSFNCFLPQQNNELSDDAQQELNIVFETSDLAHFMTLHKWKEKYIFE